MDMDTRLYLPWRTSKDLRSITGNSAQRHVAAWMGGEFRGHMDTCVCVAESLKRSTLSNQNIVDRLYPEYKCRSLKKCKFLCIFINYF